MRSLSRTLIPAVAATLALSVGAAAEPPKTEEEYAALMSEVGATFQSLQKSVNVGDAADPQADAEKLSALFADVERFWISYGKKDAERWAYGARLYSTRIAARVAAAERPSPDPRGNRTSLVQFKRLRAAVINLGTMCKQCHNTYRVGDEETGYQIKPGTLW